MITLISDLDLEVDLEVVLGNLNSANEFLRLFRLIK